MSDELPRTYLHCIWRRFQSVFSAAKRRLVIGVFTTILGLVITGTALTSGTQIHPTGIVIHHSAVTRFDDGTPVTARTLDLVHRRRGFGVFVWPKLYAIGYHYVILPNGTQEKGRPDTVKGAHAIGANDTIGICVVGNFEREPPTSSQYYALLSLVTQLVHEHHWSPSQVQFHRDVTQGTVCPGRRFPAVEFQTDLQNLELTQSKTVEPLGQLVDHKSRERTSE